MSWLVQAESEEQRERKQEIAAPDVLRSMLGQERRRRKELSYSPVRQVSPEEHFSNPAIVQRLVDDTMQRLRDYAGLVSGLLTLPDDVLALLIQRNAIKPEQWAELEANLANLPAAVDSFNQKVAT